MGKYCFSIFFFSYIVLMGMDIKLELLMCTLTRQN